MSKDWTGNNQFISVCNSRNTSSAKHDYYATSPHAVEKLLELESFDKCIWEPACGEGHISKVLEAHGHDVISTDLIYRGYGEEEPFDFLQSNKTNSQEDIITNPPYKYAREFVEKALDSIAENHKVAMFLKLTFLSSKGRKLLFDMQPPQSVYVFSYRVECGKNGKFTNSGIGGGVDYAWFVWKKGYCGPTYLKWI